MTLLSWRRSTKADKALLEQFECTWPARKMKVPPFTEIHSRPYELSLQKEIHTVPCHSNDQRAVLLGEDDDGLAAVAVAELDEGAAVTFMECVAVARRHRRCGGAAADEAVEQVLMWGEERAAAADLDEFYVLGKTAVGNTGGRALIQRHGFGLWRSDEKYDWWRHGFLLV